MRKPSFAIALAILIALVPWLVATWPTSPPPATQLSAPASPKPQAKDVEPTPEQKRFVNTVLLPLVDEICTTYPIESIRKECAEVQQWFITGKVAAIACPIHPDVGHATAGTRINEGRVEFVWFVPCDMERWEEAGHDRELYKDWLACTLVHERQHLLENLAGKGNESLGDRAKSESNAWHYEIEHATLPMMAAGRLEQRDMAIETALQIYQATGGDISDPRWLAFSLKATGR